VKDWQPLEKILVEQWLRRWSGPRLTEKIWVPLLRAKLGENYRKTSAAFIWATISRMYAARRTGMKREMFGYVPGGYARILERFRQQLEADGVHIRVSHPAQRVEPDREGVTLQFDAGRRESFDQAVLTVAAPVAARLCPALSPEEKARLMGVEYLGIVCASLLLKRPLGGYYITNITDDWVPFTAVIEMSALVKSAEFGGKTLVYLPKYVAAGDSAAFATSDAEIEEKFTAALFRMYPGITREDVLAFRVSREKYVMAIPTLGYSERVPPMETSLPGVYVVNSSQIVNGTLNVNETLKLAEPAAARLIALPRRPPLRAAVPVGSAGGGS
jgi:protoporphyrinogen oxidase